MYRLILFVMFIGTGFLHAQEKKVLVWLSTDCRLSQKYTLVLRHLSEKYKPNGVSFVGVFPANTKREVRKFSRKYQMNFSSLSDMDKRMTSQYHATITPEVVLLDSLGQVYYRGAIDNQTLALGKFLPYSTEDYLQNAINQLLLDRPCTLAQTTPIGCIIE